MQEINQLAEFYRGLGLSVMPIGDKKRPLVKWTEAQKAILPFDFSSAVGIGLICGKVSGNLEAIDFDLKYDITGDLMTRYRKVVSDTHPDLIKRLLVQKTPSGGFHFVYRCNTVDGNRKLAQRNATEDEKINGDKVLVLIETRGEGGYIGFAPFGGYSFVNGNAEKIPTITPEEREVLFSAAMQFNEVLTQPVFVRPRADMDEGESPIDDYNKRGDVVALLQKHGWTTVGQKGGKVMFKRPGKTDAQTSGNWDQQRGWFTVFTTSTVFQPQTAYSPAAVYCKLECGDDWSETVKRLLDLGYGKRKERNQASVSAPAHTVSAIPVVTPESTDFLATREDYFDNLEKIARNEFEMGLSTGIKSLDLHFLWKNSHLNMVNGFDNVGKTTMLWYLMLLSSMYHGHKWCVTVSENSPTTFFRRMTELYYGERYVGMNELKRRRALEFLESHFFLVKNDKMYSYLDLIQICHNLIAKKNINRLLIDPWNAMATVGGVKVNKHDHDHMALTELQIMCKTTGVTTMVNTHSVTGTYRNKDGGAFPKAPGKGDTEGGTKFASKGMDFLTFHRNVQDPTDWRKMEIHVRKVKETETGGRPTFATDPVVLEMEDGVRYVEISGRDPIQEWWRGGAGIVQATIHTTLPAPKIQNNVNFLKQQTPKAYDDEQDGHDYADPLPEVPF